MTMWVFAYGSLLWDPGFEVTRQEVARLDGYTRSFCMRSIHHRGTQAHPGLVLALDSTLDGHCMGLALKVAPGTEADTLAYLRERELVSSAYNESQVGLTLTDGRQIQALTYIINPAHTQYCGALALEEQAQIIAGARGGRGPNTEYLWNTVQRLGALGLPDPDLEWLAARVHALAL